MMKSKNKIQIYKPFEIRKIIIKRTWIKSKGKTNWGAFLNSKMPSAKNEVEREKKRKNSYWCQTRGHNATRVIMEWRVHWDKLNHTKKARCWPL
jgi:hypothetical protein